MDESVDPEERYMDKKEEQMPFREEHGTSVLRTVCPRSEKQDGTPD